MDCNEQRVYALTTGAVLMASFPSRTEPRRDMIYGKLTEFPTTRGVSLRSRHLRFRKIWSRHLRFENTVLIYVGKMYAVAVDVADEEKKYNQRLNLFSIHFSSSETQPLLPGWKLSRFFTLAFSHKHITESPTTHNQLQTQPNEKKFI